jgi:hypothetical protein
MRVRPSTLLRAGGIALLLSSSIAGRTISAQAGSPDGLWQPVEAPAAMKWSVNRTNSGPVNCQNVRLLLSTDGGRTYPTELSASTPNDGNERVQMPSSAGAPGQTRIMVECTTSPFFNVSAPFTLSEPLLTRAR